MQNFYNVHTKYKEDVINEIKRLEYLVTCFSKIEIEVIKFNNFESDKEIWIAGPWLGEVGVSLIRWIPYLRWIKRTNKNVYIIASGYKNYLCLYRDFVDEYWVLPEYYKEVFLNRETSYNYGVFHEMFHYQLYREHAVRKNLGIPSNDHFNIAINYLNELIKRKIKKYFFIMHLDDRGRVFYKYKPSEDIYIKAIKALESKGVDIEKDPIILFLPRMRKLQEERSWQASFYYDYFNKFKETYPRYALVILGSLDHEKEIQGMGKEIDKVVNLIPEQMGLEYQIAFWNLADIAIGPPSGGLVLAYIVGVPLIHWYKPNKFPKRKGIHWDIEAEKDYIDISGIKSSWIEVPEDIQGIREAILSVENLLKRSKQ